MAGEPSLAVVFFLLVHAGLLYLRVMMVLVAWGVGRAAGIELFPPRPGASPPIRGGTGYLAPSTALFTVNFRLTTR